MFSELTNSIKAQLYDRAKSPLTGTFVLAWALWNFKSILIFFSDLKFDEKMSHWGKLYENGTDAVFQMGVMPALSSVLFLAFYPFPARWAYHYWHWQHMETKKIQQKIEDETPLTQDEASELRKKSIEEMTQMQEELRKASNANIELTNRNREYLEKLADSKKELDRASSQLEKLTKEIAKNTPEDINIQPWQTLPREPNYSISNSNDLEIALLSALGQYENQGINAIAEEQLLNNIPGDRLPKKVALEELMQKHEVLVDANRLCSLTHIGRKRYMGIYQL